MKHKRILQWTGACAALCLTLGAQAQITDRLVVHLPFDNDYSNTRGNAVTATPQGSPTFGAGKIGSGAVTVTYAAGGAEINYVTLGSPTELWFGAVSDGSATDFTVSFWLRYVSQSSDPSLISNKDWNSSSNQGWGIFGQGGGNLRVNTTDDRGSAGRQSTTSTPNVRDGNWHHVATVWDRESAVLIYVDGVLVTTSSLETVTGSIDTSYPINIGQDGTGLYDADMVANMDDLGIWRRALTAGEITAIYNAGLAGTNIANVPSIPNPYVKSTSPVSGTAGVSPVSPVSAIVTDGLNAVAPASIKLLLNGAEVPVTVNKVGADTTITHTPTAALTPGVVNARLIYANNATPATSFTNDWSFSVAFYVSVTPDLKVTPDTSKPGFQFNIFANQANRTDTLVRTEAALAGQLRDETGPLPNYADPAAQGAAIAPASAPSPANAPVRFEISSVINLNVIGGGAAGQFTPDDQVPGLPSVDFYTEGVAAEIITYLELPAGIVTMVVASDDGFRTSVGKPAQDVLKAKTAGFFDGGRGVAPTQFYLHVQEAGVYGFRTIWENGGGDGNIEWYTVKADGTRVLINDLAAGGVRAYRATTSPVPAYVKYITPEPAPRQLNQSSSSLTVLLADGTVPLNDNSVQMKLNGVAVGTKSRQGGVLTLSHTPAGIMFPADPNQLELTFSDTAGTATSINATVMNLKNVVLPAPVIVEDFNSYAEGGIPTGWLATNYTTTGTEGEDIDNLNSDTYKGWVLVNRERLQGLKGRIFNGPASNQFSNGVAITELASGNVLYAESDVRGGSQVQFIYSKPFNLSNVTNAAISFASLYEQNQDNIGAVEYSIDGGNSWLPVVYFLDFADGGGDIRLNPDGTVDAVATFTNPNPDTAVWVENGVNRGGIYGDGILAPITQELGRFVAPRQNDNSTEGKRLEIYRLEKAGGKADVRLRFSQLGTGSWYFGVDDLAFYNVPTAPPVAEQPVITLQRGTNADTLVISWTGSGTLYEGSTPLGPWVATPSQANPQNLTIGTDSKFFRVGP